MQDLTDALAETGATLAFDAIGGGKLAGQILGCMEAAINRTAKEYSRYGSTTHKQVYIYGGLDTRPDRVRAQLRHGLGHRRLAAVPVPAEDRRRRAAQALSERVAAELKTTFASHYSQASRWPRRCRPEAIAGLRPAGDRRRRS